MLPPRSPKTSKATARKCVTVSEFKAQLSFHLARVRAGGEVLVTQRGRPIARITPTTAADDPEAFVKILVAAGLARLPCRRLGDDFFHRPRGKYRVPGFAAAIPTLGGGEGTIRRRV
jgi:prevent-host-death family protein